MNPTETSLRVRDLIASWPVTPKAGWSTYCPPKPRLKGGNAAKAPAIEVDGANVTLPAQPTKADVFTAMVLYLCEWTSPKVALAQMTKAVGADEKVVAQALYLSGVNHVGEYNGAELYKLIVDSKQGLEFLQRLAILALPDATTPV